MERTITGFHEDEEGDAVAELDCGHRQHVRHRPPFAERAWVLDPRARAARIGTAIECPLCGRAELPEGWTVERRLGPWDETDVPEGLRQEHRTPHGGWARLVVLAGELDFVLPDAGASAEAPLHLVAEAAQPIPPGAPHRVVIAGPVRLHLELLAVPGETRRPPA